MNQYRKELSVDLYELTMSQVFWRRHIEGSATFSLFFRGYPKDRGYYIASGINQALDFLEDFHFADRDIEAIRNVTPLDDDFVDFLADIRFTGEVRAVSEGTIVFSDEPILEVTGSLIETQIVETMLLNIVTTACLLATKASRIVQAAAGRPVVDFGSRRTHSEETALQAARTSYIAGFTGTSNVKAAAMFGIPALGTMAHSYIQAFDDERAAFDAYIDEFPQTTTLLVDTYDTLQGVRNTIEAAHEASKRGRSLNGIRLDSGDLGKLSKSARKMLDEANLHDVPIIASGGLDEHSIADLVASNAPIDAFGVGTRYGTSADAPYIDSVYKLVEFNGRPITKLSASKQTRPWAKQVYRKFSNQEMNGDIITRSSSTKPQGYSEALLETVMQNGRQMMQSEPVDTIRNRVTSSLRLLPYCYRKLRDPELYPVEYSDDLDIKR